jgi:hypothetical protein
MHPKNMKARNSDMHTNIFLSDYILADIFSDISYNHYKCVSIKTMKRMMIH